MPIPVVHTLDLDFLGRPGAIAAYLIPHSHGAALVETGPGSTIPSLVSQISQYGFKPGDITDVFLTHIHLDHAGASGWLANQGAMIHVHPNGAPHLSDPGKLLASAARIYGSQMESLWGQFLPVGEKNLHPMKDGEVFTRHGLVMRAIEAPGHAFHHNVYFSDDLCFTGDVGGIRVHGLRYLSLPLPPPEFHPGLWRETIQRLRAERPTHIAPTHFGIYNDADWHFNEIINYLDRIEAWMETTFAIDHPIEKIREMFIELEMNRAREAGLDASDIDAQQIANPSFMSADGIQRYWKKYRS